MLPCAVAIGGIAVGALGWRQVDPSFASFFDDAMVKVCVGCCPGRCTLALLALYCRGPQHQHMLRR